MTPYERGYAAGLKAAAEACDMEHVEPVSTEDEAYNVALVHARQAILSLPIVGEADQRGAAATCTEGATSETGESQNRASGGKLEAQSVPHPNPGEPLPDFDSLADIAAEKQKARKG